MCHATLKNESLQLFIPTMKTSTILSNPIQAQSSLNGTTKRWDFTPSTLQARVSLGWSILDLPSSSGGDCGQGQADDRAEYVPIRCLTSETALSFFFFFFFPLLRRISTNRSRICSCFDLIYAAPFLKNPMESPMEATKASSASRRLKACSNTIYCLTSHFKLHPKSPPAIFLISVRERPHNDNSSQQSPPISNLHQGGHHRLQSTTLHYTSVLVESSTCDCTIAAIHQIIIIIVVGPCSSDQSFYPALVPRAQDTREAHAKSSSMLHFYYQ